MNLKKSIFIIFLVFFVSSKVEAGFLSALKDGWDDFVDFVDDAADTVVDTAKDAVSAVSNTYNNVQEKITNFFSKSISTLTSVEEKAKKFTTKTYSEASSTVTDFLDDFTNLYENLEDEIETFAKNVLGNLDIPDCFREQQCVFCQSLELDELAIDTDICFLFEASIEDVSVSVSVNNYTILEKSFWSTTQSVCYDIPYSANAVGLCIKVGDITLTQASSKYYFAGTLYLGVEIGYNAISYDYYKKLYKFTLKAS